MSFDNGKLCEVRQITSDKAKQLAEYLIANHNSFVSFDECRTNETKDIVCITVQPELSQIKTVNICSYESFAVHFDKEDKILPSVYALREDFPRQVPHLNLEYNGWPTSLCLYNELYRDIKVFWTPARFIERIRKWLKETASGTLHEKGQPLEPLFFGYNEHIILPQALYDSLEEGISPQRLILMKAGDAWQAVNIDDKLIHEYKSQNGKPPPTAFCIKLPPQEHGIISHTPLCLQDVSQLMAKADYNLYDEFYLSIKSGSLTIDDSVLNSPFCIVGWFPKKRNSDSTPETTDVWVFISTKTVADVLVDIGAYDCVGRIHSLRIAGRDENRNGENIDIIPLNPSFTLSADFAALFNGYEEASPHKVLAIGAGAIGSNIVLNSIKAGFGNWVLIDDDIILPHNLARHALDGTYLGLPKVEAIKLAANQSLSQPLIIETLKADLMQAEDDLAKKIANHLTDSEIILDMSASVSVARHITHDIISDARRISMFLSPSGKDFVILAEDQERQSRLDLLEMQYYRELMLNESLKDHLASTSKTRYANSCRDLSSQISQDYVALHAAIGSRNLRQIASSENACIKIYRTDEEMQVRSINVPIENFTSVEIDDWEILINESTINELFSTRQNKLPNETGGILIGFFNIQNRKLYIVGIIGDLTDSGEYPEAFIRGCKGLSERVQAIQSTTAGNLTYVGEWHSHPDHAKCYPSQDDQQVIKWINDYMSAEGLPSVMLIAGENSRICVCINQKTKVLECEDVREKLAIAV